MSSPIDNRLAIVAEVTAGTTPATPPFLTFPAFAGASVQWQFNSVQSNILNANRSGNGIRTTDYHTDGMLQTNLKQDPAIDLLFQSAMGGTYATNVLKAGATDSNFTFQSTMKEGATSYYFTHAGCQAADFNMKVDAAGMSDLQFKIMGHGAMVTSSTLITGATYAAPAATPALCGIDLTGLTVAGLTSPVFRSLDLQVSTPKEVQPQFGTAFGRGVGATGMRKVQLTLELYRTDYAAETAFLNSTGTAAVSFTLGGVGTGYTFTLPAAQMSNLDRVENGSANLIKLVFVNKYDPTSGTDFQITRL